MGLSTVSRGAHLRLVETSASFVEIATVAEPVKEPVRPKRLFLTPAEVEALIKSAEKRGRWGKRDLVLWERGDRTEKSVKAPRMYRWDQYMRLTGRMTYGAVDRKEVDLWVQAEEVPQHLK